MIYALVGLVGILAVLMILIILAQDSKSGALSSNFGASQVMGVKRTTDLLEKLTWGFMIGIIVVSLSFKFVTGSDEPSEGPTSVNVEKAKSKPAPVAPSQTPAPAPAATPDSGQ